MSLPRQALGKGTQGAEKSRWRPKERLRGRVQVDTGVT